MMRIGFDAKRAFFNTTGLGNYSRLVLQGLSRYYPQNEYLLYTPPLPTNDLFPLRDRRNTLVQMPNSRLGRAFPAWWRTMALGKQVAADKVQIYHGLSHELPAHIRQSGAKSVVTIHDLIFLRYPHLYPAVDRWFYTRKIRSACQNADVIVAISQQTKADIIHWLNIDPARIEVVYQTCDSSFYQYNDQLFLQHGLFAPMEFDLPYRLPREYILYVGSITPRKNLLVLLKALAQLRPQLDVHLAVAGSFSGQTPYEREVQAYIAQEKLENNVSFLQHVPSEHLPMLYRCAQLLVYPSQAEGFGIPIIEALFSRIPVITTDDGCFREAGGKTTLYVEAGNAEYLATAIQSVLTDPAQAMNMRLDGWNYVQQFGQQFTTASLMRVYEQLLPTFAK